MFSISQGLHSCFSYKQGNAQQKHKLMKETHKNKIKNINDLKKQTNHRITLIGTKHKWYEVKCCFQPDSCASLVEPIEAVIVDFQSEQCLPEVSFSVSSAGLHILENVIGP